MREDAEDSAPESSGSKSGDGQARLAAATRAESVESVGLVGVGGGDSRGGGAAGGKDDKGRRERRFLVDLVLSSGEMGEEYSCSGETGTSDEKLF